MKSKQELVDLLWLRTGISRAALSMRTVAELETILTDHHLGQVRAEAAHAAEAADEELIRLQAERSADHVLHQLRMASAREPQRKAESERLLAQDKKAFAEAARTLRTFGECDANFSVLRQVLGEGNLSAHTIKQVIESGAVSLAGPTQQELNDWERERIESHNEMLRNADVETLRRLAKQEREQNRQRVAQEQVDRGDAARAERDRYRGYPPLPDTFQGQPLDSEFIKKCSAETLRHLIKMAGPSQVTARLRGEN